jgi:hypothetical protein
MVDRGSPPDLVRTGCGTRGVLAVLTVRTVPWASHTLRIRRARSACPGNASDRRTPSGTSSARLPARSRDRPSGSDLVQGA